MSSISWPAGLTASGFSLSLATVQRQFSSPFTGSEQVVDLLQDRWTATVTLPPNVQSLGGAVEGFVASLRNMTNTVNLWHMARPTPLGTMRGAPTIVGEHAQGSSSLAVATVAGATLKQGDMIGLGGFLLMVAADCTADGTGAITIPIANRLRTLVSNGSVVTWDKPSVPFRMTTKAPARMYAPGVADALTLDFVEAVS